MPEGDTVYRAAATLRKALVGAVAEEVEGAGLRGWAARLAGRRIEGVESRGKHLFVHFAGGLSLRTHLGTAGSWHLRPAGRPGSSEAVRVAIHTDAWVAVCRSAPTVRAGPTAAVTEGIAHLGPDLLGESFDAGEVVRRARAAGPATLADLVVDQRVMAGAGNVYKSEVLFLEGHHPRTHPARLADGDIAALAQRARRLLTANRETGRRVTTGTGRRGAELWVYGRPGRPCRRCGKPIERAWVGDPGRVTFWCPACQPAEPANA